MYLKEVEFLALLYQNLKEIGVLVLLFFTYTLIKALNHNIMYQKKSTEKLKSGIRSTLIFLAATIVSLIYLLVMISLSMSQFPVEEFRKYVMDWNESVPFLILIIIYSMVFALALWPFIGEHSRKYYYMENVGNIIIEREIINRLTIGNRDKLILKDGKETYTEVDVTDVTYLKYKIQRQNYLSIVRDIESHMRKIKDKHIAWKIMICSIAFGIPSVYLIWQISEFIDQLKNFKTYIYMYIGILTLPVIVLTELYVLAWVVFRSLFTKKSK
ncbi:hypothetical protein [Staphylococcus pseudintermedius]|uniref:hypothetical protein n=1 Tax=Staphylococcus pseudintermedius TaxID=283734 RepID=UPI0018E0DB60|nr:hypothetical protein [Staphylococcus pseudintermedius]EGQ2712984.1 hypothetical protein [Staphylococcus pseudintermedius]EGQ2917809.1 hypothetical protein [Staphylococcus pseudintermedius]EGQ3431551.1 hypothetical protein [Staphylococcus pseudintermedius]EGQ3438900.1 hypothetical protein [Staphylococcus pseudintermedius]EGQ4040473.1 hypothetical protein [Staphylococcus pseudintermedius]